MSVPSRRYLSVWLRRLSTDRIERRLSASGDAPLVVVEPVKSALRIRALNDAAARCGLQPGMPLADAHAMYPSLWVEDADPQADLALLEVIADWCDRYTPLVGLDPPDGLMLDISGCAHLFSGEAKLGHDLITRLARQGMQARVGLADTPGCAWAVARYGAAPPLHVMPGLVPGIHALARKKDVDGRDKPGHDADFESVHVKNALVPQHATRDALLPLPLAALRLDHETVSALVQVGLRRIADVVERPRAPLAARFGEKLIRRLDQAFGHEEESIAPRLPLPRYITERRFPEPVALEADVLGTIEQLARELGQILERRGEGARLLQAALFRADGKVYRLETGTSEPLRDSERIRRLFDERLAVVGDDCDPGFGYDVIRLSALVTERLEPAQSGLAGNDHQKELAHLVDRLSARFGMRRMTRFVPCDTHIPEYAANAIPAQIAGDGAAVSSIEQDSLAPVRPLRLFARPEPVEAVAEVPDGPPVRFRWRRVLQEVVAAEGPERIAMEWWRDDRGRALTRDYFRVECRQGTRVWLYREGLYEREPGNPRWFLHGLFA